jgi:hypothetical protein
MKSTLKAILFASTVLASGSANALTITWADLTSTSATASQVVGTIGDIGVTYSGSYAFAQTTGGTDYWVDYGYTQGVVNRPTGTDIIALSNAGTKTITFSQPVTNPVMAFTSWNGNHPTFSAPFTLVSEGRGYWGTGTFQVDSDNKGFYGLGEVHGILMFPGTFTSLTFTNTGEYWHGITVGLAPVPLPAALPLFGTALGGMGLLGWRKNRKNA